jgi:hypothetical protein
MEFIADHARVFWLHTDVESKAAEDPSALNEDRGR